MNLLEIVGAVTLTVLGAVLLWVVYHVVRGFVLACDCVIWQYAMTKQKNPNLKFELTVFLRGVMRNWSDMIGYTPDSFTCSMGSSTWSGFGSWRKK